MKKFLLIFLFLSINLFGMEGFSNLPSFETLPQQNAVSEKKKNYQELITFLSQSNNGEYLFYLAIIYANGINTPDDYKNTVKRDVDKSVIYFNKAINNGYYNAAAILGAFYLYHESFMILPDNIKKSKKVLQLALKNKVYEATTFLADIYFNYENNPEKGLELLFLGADHNNAQAQLMVATIYGFGYNQGSFSVKKNDVMASQYLTMACTNKNKTKKIEDFCSKYAENHQIKK